MLLTSKEKDRTMKAIIAALMIITVIYGLMTFSNIEKVIKERTNQIDKTVIAAMK